jgi:hypothetical protein
MDSIVDRRGSPYQGFVGKLGTIDMWRWTKSFAAIVVTGGQW